MSDNGSNMQPVRPLTRREIREREQAAAAQRAAQAGGTAPEPSATGATSQWTPAQPARPAAAPTPPPSRRTLRETTGPTEHPSQPSVVRPPAASGGMRGLDETGRLTPVQETAERVMIRPPAPTPAVPTRTSSRPPAGAPRPAVPGASGPVRPPTPTGDPFSTSSGRTPAPGTPAPSPFGQRVTPAPAPNLPPTSQPQRMSAFASSTAATTTPRSAEPPSATPWGATQVQPAAREPAEAPPARPSTPPPAEPSGSALPWAAITSGDAPEPARPVEKPVSPFGTTSGSPAAVAPAASAPGGDDLFPRVHGRSVESADDEAEDDVEPRGPSYTWLHYLILVAVAFVLGLLVWELISRDDTAPAVDDAAAVIETVDPADPAWAPDGALGTVR